MTVRVNVTGVSTSPDFVSVSYVKLTYPENFNQNSLGSKYYILNQNAGNKSYIEITNVPANERIFDITDQKNHQHFSEQLVDVEMVCRFLWRGRCPIFC